MTLLDHPPSPPAPTPSASPPAGKHPARAAARRSRDPIRRVVSTTVTILSLVLLGFGAYIGFFSQLHHDRAQHNAYANFRKELALATAPTGPTQPAHPDRLLSLGTPVAVLAIPELKLREVVFEGTTAAVLQDGPGHLRDTPLPGQAGISEIMGRAAAYGGPFGKLSQLTPGDPFSVTTGQGVQNYRVLDIRRAGDAQPAPLPGGGSRLVLATADGTPYIPSGVLRVDAELTTPVQPTPSQVVSSADLSPAEQALATDPSAWYPLVLWGQALVLAVALVTWMRLRWGRWQTWIVAVPLIVFLSLAVADQAARLLPNLT